MDNTDFEGSDAELRDLSPPRAAPRGRGAPGAGLGPVRFGDAVDATFPEDAENADDPKRAARRMSAVPLSREAETSRGRRALGEPPAWRNPRARVPFREAHVRRHGERGPRKERALARAASKGWAPRRAPEWNALVGTGEATRARRERRVGAPTVAFEEEFEQFKMMKLRERAAKAGTADDAARRFARGAYAPVGSDEDVDEDDDASFRAEGVEREEEREVERGETESAREARVSTLPRRESEPPESTATLLRRHELIRRAFGKETSPEASERRSARRDDSLDPVETEMAKLLAGDGDALSSAALEPTSRTRPGPNPARAIPAMTAPVPAALRFAAPPEPEPRRDPALWPTPFGRPENDVPNRVVREDVAASYPVPPPEERGLPAYAERHVGRNRGLAALAFARSVGTGTVGASGFAGAGGGHAPDPRALRANEGAETLGLGPFLPPGFLASEQIQQLAETLSRKGDYEGGGGRVDLDIAAGRGGRADAREETREDAAPAASFRKRVSASKRAVTANVEAGLAGRSPAGGTLMDLVPLSEELDASAAPGETPATRAPVASGSQTMSLNAHARAGRH